MPINMSRQQSAQIGRNLGQAIFGGGPPSVKNGLEERLLANELASQNAILGSLENFDGTTGSLDPRAMAAGVGLGNFNQKGFSALSLDPRLSEEGQRRASIAAGRNDSLGQIASDMAAQDALAQRRLRDDATSSKMKPRKLLPSNLQKIREEAIAGSGLDREKIINTIKSNESLGQLMNQVIGQFHNQSQGNAAETIAGTQDFISNVLLRGEPSVPGGMGEPEETGFLLSPGAPRYRVKDDLGDVFNEFMGSLSPQQQQSILGQGVTNVNTSTGVPSNQPPALDTGAVLQDAANAIRYQGKDPAIIRQRLQEQFGIDPSLLDEELLRQ